MGAHSIEATWSVLQGEQNGKPMFVRLNTGARAVAGSSAYGIRVGVAIPLREPRPDGLPDKAESDQLAAIEAALLAVSSEHAILVAVITTGGMREFVFYTGAGDWIPEFHQRMMRTTPSHEVQCMAERDPKWAVYRRLGGTVGERVVESAAAQRIVDNAVAKQPDEIHLIAAAMSEEARAQTEASTRALQAHGFVDVGEYAITEMTGVQVRFLLNAKDNCYACVYRHPRAGSWVEIITRYQSGLGATYTQQPDRGFARRKEDLVTNLPGSDPATLHKRMVAERPNEAMITLSAENIPRLFEQVYAAQIRWKKERRATPGEAANVIQSQQKHPIGKRTG